MNSFLPKLLLVMVFYQSCGDKNGQGRHTASVQVPLGLYELYGCLSLAPFSLGWGYCLATALYRESPGLAMGSREDSTVSVQLCGCLGPTGFLEGWTPTAYLLSNASLSLSSQSSSGVTGVCAYLTCVSPQPKPGEQPLFLPRARPALACSLRPPMAE